MLKREPRRTGTRVTFALPVCTETGAVSVVGDFNGWDPAAHPMKKRSNGMRSVSVELPPGGTYRFKYLSEKGDWFCEPAADGEAWNEFHTTDSVLLV